MEITDICCPITEHTDRHIIIFCILVAECQTSCNGEVSANNRVPAPEILFHAGHVHRATLTFRHARGLAKQFRHYLISRKPAVDGNPMVAIGGDYALTWLTGR